MPLMLCPDCKKEIYDIAPLCIHCGRPTFAGSETFLNSQSVALIAAVLDRILERHNNRSEKEQLIRQMCSRNSDIAQDALETLRVRNLLIDGSLQGALLYKANLVAADLSDANLQCANLSSADLRKANLTRICLDGAQLQGANLEYLEQAGGARLVGADLSGVNLANATISDVDFQRAIFHKAKVAFSKLQRVNLESSDLLGADFNRATLINISLRQANLREVNLEHSFISEVDLEGANMAETTIQGSRIWKSNLFGVTGLTVKQLTSTVSLLGTIMPNGSRYDGRFNLSFDLQWMPGRSGNPEDRAKFYGISIEDYLRGQELAQQGFSEAAPVRP